MIIKKRIPFGYFFKTIKWELLTVTIFSTIVHLLSYQIDFNLEPSVGVFMGTAISLILSFKLSQSYDRWWESRKIWGSIVNDSRTLVVQLKNFPTQINKEILQKIAYRQIAWCYSLGQSLRDLNPKENINTFLSDEEYNSITPHKNIPLKLIDFHAADIKQLHLNKQINDFQQVQIDNTLVNLVASMGKAERIKNTHFPQTYRITLHIFLYMFLFLLSFSLTEMHSYLEIPTLIFISIPFFLLEKVAYYIQDPFKNKPTDTAVTSIARTIEINIKQLLDEKNIPDPTDHEKYYIL